MDDFKLKRTRKIIAHSIAWLLFSFYIADTYGYRAGFFGASFNFYFIQWEVFIISGTPVWIYWTYYWISRGDEKNSTSLS